MREKYVTGEKIRNQILEHIRFYQKNFNRPPTIDEIADHIGFSKSGTWFHLKKLKKLGRIDYERYHTRTIKINKDPICDICELRKAIKTLHICAECGARL